MVDGGVSKVSSPVGFVIVGTQRTGTTLIRKTLDSHPEICCWGEVFLIWRGRWPFAKAVGHNIPMSYRQYLNKSIGRKSLYYLCNPISITQYLDAVYSISGYSAVGFKLMASQSRYFRKIVPYIHSHGLKVIHVVRRNILKTLISRLMLKRTGVAHSQTKMALPKIHVNTKNLIATLDKIRKDDEYWRKKCQDMDYMVIEYESFVSNKKGELENIQLFVGVEKDMALKAPLHKINSDNLSEIVSNWEEVVKTLSGTQYEECIQ